MHQYPFHTVMFILLHNLLLLAGWENQWCFSTCWSQKKFNYLSVVHKSLTFSFLNDTLWSIIEHIRRFILDERSQSWHRPLEGVAPSWDGYGGSFQCTGRLKCMSQCSLNVAIVLLIDTRVQQWVCPPASASTSHYTNKFLLDKTQWNFGT